MVNWSVFGGTNKLLLMLDPTPDTPALNCLGVRVTVNLKPELSKLSTVVVQLK